MKRVLVRMAVAALVASVAFAQTRSQTTAQNTTSSELLAEARRAIDKGNAQWVAGWEKGDPARVAAIFTEDGVLLARNGRVTKGRQQIQERQKAAMQSAGKGVRVTVTTVDVWLDGGTAYETGKYSYRYQEKGNPVT